ncbi:MAG: coproporphyrinogen dehydrogenase HemZ [Clostridiales bacterium]|nr:coproporphyrinogen dehydrogenase HemZ [Clostridiales bacterium]
MIVYEHGNTLNYELKLILELFLPQSQIQYTEDKDNFHNAVTGGAFGLTVETDKEVTVISSIEAFSAKVLEERTLFALEDSPKNQFKKHIYQLMSQSFESLSKWGTLVGIRPVKIVHELLDKNVQLHEIKPMIAEEYLVSPEKIDLLIETALRERPHLYPHNPDLISLYICIPFCPTRCLYCSFPSNDLQKKGKLLPIYLDKLIEELDFAVGELKRNGKTIDCVYVGGGTPTSLDEDQLERLLSRIGEHVNIDEIKEFTVEAGRPDTITLKKLEIMKSYGVDRICINPQTMNDQTLITIGRDHGADQITDVMRLARSVGFKTINMDLIMGLPGETVDDAEKTVESIIKMAPENITVHTLAVKRASALNESRESVELAHDSTVEAMLVRCDARLRAVGHTPYYMYRQKKMIGHLENIGYALKGHSSLYNMRIMEEKHTIIALGAGAVSKLCYPEENRHERVANFKGLEDYINRFEEVLEKKKVINSL